MSSYWSYYLAFVLLSYLVRQPWLLAGVVVFLLLRKVIPDPGAIFRAIGRSSRLRTQVEVNAANVTARRDLALLYLDLRRPRAAIPLVEQALARAPDDAELLYVSGLALHRAGRHEAALGPLVRAVEIDPRVRFGHPYFIAGESLAALGRIEASVDAYERYVECNGSDVAGHVRLARAQARLGDREGARKSIREALHTWRVVPGRMKRRFFSSGYLAAHWARAWVLREPTAMITFIALFGAVAAAGYYAYPAVVRLATVRRPAAPPWAYASGVPMSPDDQALIQAFSRCGSQDTGDFAGRYAATDDSPERTPPPGATREQLEAIAAVKRFVAEQLTDFEVKRDRITSGTSLVQEYCLTRILERTPGLLRAEAVWHEDMHDPGDASLVEIRLAREGDTVRFALAGEGSDGYVPIATLRKQ